MSDKINIQEIIQNRFGFTDEEMIKLKKSLSKAGWADWQNWMDAIEEIVETVVDKCAEEVDLTGFAAEFMQEGAYEAIDKDSILNVKQMINYD